MQAKTLFFGVWKTQYDFFSFETLGRMRKNLLFFLFLIFFSIFESFDENRVF
jgi:hypothetical protein